MSPSRPARSRVRIDTMIAPYEIVRTSVPAAFVSVKISTGVRSGVAPNGARVTDAASMTTAMAAAAGIGSELHEIGDRDRPLLVDAVADRDARQARHRAGAR